MQKVNKGLLLAGVALTAEGVALAVWGNRYIDYMERQGLMDTMKRSIRKLDIRSQTVFTAIGLAELVWGLVLLRRAQPPHASPIAPVRRDDF